ncbi:mycofactocin system transcriptional regulator [Nocardioides sp. CFH 31398]|uniref:mycofactocin system transcriptional regulator n=1 Tax=Nocardioides sp. CFH 31398 TaxID=2919579 RepID=UPI001F0700E6|nr:mycofactocin system transcriptional regulator [Nocardioides sp. CFH 31398]MCH1866401.1 mycofactocin system transcriptional regulator [Nocardioides sp. CFH 31398]
MAGPGRPSATTHAAIETTAFRLFAERGFDATPMELIASEVGVGRRTLFRYFPSKNDICWGAFDDTLGGFAAGLAATPDDVPLWRAVHRAVVDFNDFPLDADPPHEQRMRLILGTPALQAHSVLRYAQWRAVIAAYVARRTGATPDALLPRTVGHVSLALSLAAYERWLDDTTASLPGLVDEAMTGLRDHLAP